MVKLILRYLWHMAAVLMIIMLLHDKGMSAFAHNYANTK